MMNVLIADDHWIVRAGLKMLINRIYTAANIEEVSNGPAVLQLLQKSRFDLVLLDLTMPETDPVALVIDIQTHYAHTPLLIVTRNHETVYGKRYLQLGAYGFIQKTALEDEFIKAITLVGRGGRYISPVLADKIASDFLAGRPVNPFDALSAREFQIAVYYCQEMTTIEIAERLSIRYSTVSTYKYRIFEKLHIQSYKELVGLGRTYNL